MLITGIRIERLYHALPGLRKNRTIEVYIIEVCA